jgi:hypothetical protein
MNKIIKLSEQEFINKYWYASELKELAKNIGISKAEKFRKDELEKIILKYIKTGKLNIPKKIRSNNKSNMEDVLRLNTIIKNYKNDKKTWFFINQEIYKLEPNFKVKSGAKYWLNRWREKEIEKGNTITYSDLIKEYIRLNNINRLPQIPSAKFNNFITDYLKKEEGKTRTDAVKAWEKLKKMNIPKDYNSWKKN